jgi:two-component system NarL family response regulator
MAEVARIRVLIVDDHVLVRAGLAGLLSRTRRCEVVAEAATGAQAVVRFSRHHPDVTLLDRWLPDMCGEEVVTRLRERDPSACVIMVSIDEGEDDIHRALRAGARGYVSKSIGRDELLAAIEAVCRGETYVSETLRDRLELRRTRHELNRRELEVLQRLAEGRSNRAIADTLGLSEVTVKVYVGRILQKLEVRDRTHAVTTAIARGIVHLA